VESQSVIVITRDPVSTVVPLALRRVMVSV